jgi:hypothetical protein
MASLALALSLFEVPAASGRGTAADARDEFAVLDKLSNDLVNSDSYYGRKRLVVSEGRIALMDFGADQPGGAQADDIKTRLLECLARVKTLRRDFASSFPGASFWVEPLDRIEDTVRDLDASHDATTRNNSKLAMMKVDEQFRSLERLTTAYATEHHVETSASREPATPYEVQIQTDPPKIATVKYMTYLSYRRCLAFKIALDEQWLVMPEGKCPLIGKYRYRVEWPAELGGPVEGTLEITRDSNLTFRPVKR